MVGYPFLFPADWDDNQEVSFFLSFLEDDKALGSQFLLFLSTFLRRTTPQIRTTQLRSISEQGKKYLDYVFKSTYNLGSVFHSIA